MLLTGAAGAAGVAAWSLSWDALALVAEPLRRSGVHGLQTLPFDDALLGICAAVLLACVGWLLLTGSLAVAAQVAEQVAPHRPTVRALCAVSDRTCPQPVRRLVAAALGVALSTGLAAVPAGATPPQGPDRLTGLPVPDRVTGGLPVPDRVTGGAAAPHTPAPPARVVVRPGQSLWLIAQDLLRDRARSPARQPPTDAQVTAAWHLLHRANEAAIGADPDLILPGTRLVVPDLTATAREDSP